MLVRLHSQATPTPKIRAAIQARDEPAWILAERHATTEQTVWKWRNTRQCSGSEPPPPSSDHPDRAQEAVADALRNTWRVSLCAINRATRRVFIAMYRHKTAANARRFLGDLKRACPMRSRTILTGMASRSPTAFGVRRRTATRPNAFDTLYSTLGIEPRLAHRDRRKPTAWLSSSTAAARPCCKVTMFDQVKIWG